MRAAELTKAGFADRPAGFDYTLAGLGRWAGAAVEALGLDRFHLVVHNAGGPVGFEMVADAPGRIRSLALLDTVVQLDRVPFVMEVYACYAVGRGWPALPPARVFRTVFRAVAVADGRAISPAEVDAYRELVLREDGGAAYLKIMRNLRRGAHDYRAVVDSRSTPSGAGRLGRARPRAAAKHFLQEDHAPELAELVAAFAATA